MREVHVSWTFQDVTNTNTLRALVGFLDPSSGSIEVNGTDVTHLEPKAWNCIELQSYALFPTMTVFDNIAHLV